METNDIVRKVAAEMLNTSMQDITAEVIYGWATRLGEVAVTDCNQPVTDCHGLNAAKMREALREVAVILNVCEKTNVSMAATLATIAEVVKAALAEPLRNCDVGTAKEQSARFDKFCYDHRSYEKGCEKCPLLNDVACCELAWSQMPYETVKTNKTKTNKGE